MSSTLAIAGLGHTASTHGMPLDAVQEDTLWDRFKREGDMSARDMLISHYLDFARIMAGRAYAQRYRDTVDFGEYMQMASMGLIEAVDRFSPDDGRATFRSYAAHWIRGSILNGLRNLSEVHAQIEARKRSQRDRLHSLARTPQEDGDDPPPAELDPFQRMVDIAMGAALGFMLDDLRIYQSADGVQEDNCYTDAEMRRLRKILGAAVRRLSGKERELIDGHYFEGHTFDDIARKMSLSKGRVSQLHKRALGMLHTTLKEAGHGEWSI